METERSETLLFSDAVLRMINCAHDYDSRLLEPCKDLCYKWSKETGMKAAIEKVDKTIAGWRTELSSITDKKEQMEKFKTLVESAV